MKVNLLCLTILSTVVFTHVNGQREIPIRQQKIEPVAVIPLTDRIVKKSDENHPIILSNDSSGVFYLNQIYRDSLTFKKLSETSSENFVIALTDFDVKIGLQHTVVKDKNKIILLNLRKGSIQSYDCKSHGNITRCPQISNTKIKLDKYERLVRIEKDNQNVYLLSYNFKSSCQNFYRLNTENNAIKLLYVNYNPFVEIFFSDDNVSNYSFYNNKLALTDFYTGNTLIINLSNSHIDSVKAPFVLCKKPPTLATFHSLKQQYEKHNTWANYDSLMNLVYNYNRTVNSFFLNDTTLLIVVRFKDLNSGPFEMIAVNVSTQRTLFEQSSHRATSAKDTVNLSNMPIFLRHEESNYNGDGTIYVYKEIPELNKHNSMEFYDIINQEWGPKMGAFILYKSVISP
jgi:hypothetical protein